MTKSGSRFGLALVFVSAVPLFAALFFRFPVLYDGDSYFHLAAARLYASGIPEGLPWARFSVMHEGWGDKELLFHVFLLPFTWFPDAAMGGRIALALLNALLLTLLSWLGARAIGRWGLLAGPAAYMLQPDFLNRGFRLRPELLAVILLILLIDFAGKRRTWVVVMLSAAFAMSYTAAHVPVGLSLLWVARDRLRGREWNFRLPLAVTGGVMGGLVLHPHFPKNIEIWWIQNIRFFEFKQRLDVGEEILPPGIVDVALANLPLALALATLWVASRETSTRQSGDSTASYFGISAFAFVVLYLLMARMVTWMVPLVVLAIVFAIADRGWKPRRGIAVGRWTVPVVVMFIASFLIALPRHANPSLVNSLVNAELIRNEVELAEFGARVPDGARVAATWRDAEFYVFYAPQATYLNVLDPIFMAIPSPVEFEAQGRVFRGLDPDTPLTLASVLDSGMIAFNVAEVPPMLVERVERDPRFQVLHRKRNLLAAVRPDDSFMLDWEDESSRRWPRSLREEDRALEGYVDLLRLGSTTGCRTVSHELTLASRSVWTLDFAPWGTGYLRINGQKTGIVGEPALAILNSGARITADLGEGTHRIEVTTCAYQEGLGFYLRRDRGSGR